MFTDETYRQLKLFFRLTFRLTSNLPFDYDEKASELVELSIGLKLWYFLMLVWTAFRCVYHVFWILSGFVYGFPTVADTTIEISFAVLSFTAVFMNTVVYCERQTFMEMVNQMLKANKLYSEHFLTPEAKTRGRHWNSGIKYNDGCWLYMKLLTPSVLSSSLMFGMLFLYQPHNRLYYYSYVFQPDNSTVYMGFYFLLESFSICWILGILYFLWYCSLLYANSSSFWLDQIRYV